MTAARLRASEAPLCEVHDVALMDLDGVCYRGDLPVEHADRAIEDARAASMRMLFVTNNAAREPQTVADQLVRLGIAATPEEVMTSAQAAAAVLAADLRPGAPVLAVGGAGLTTALQEVGLTVVTSAEDAPHAVAQGFSRDLGWHQLTEAAYAIRAGARYVATNLDATLPTERGLAVGNGSLVAAVRSATGVDPVSAGKPQPAIFEQACRRADARSPLAVGDRLDTDLAGARAADIPGLHVLTGVSDARDVLLAAPHERPSYLAVDLRGLLEPHPAPSEGADGWWECGSAAARVDAAHHRLEVRDGESARVLEAADAAELSLDGWRAATAATWAAADAGSGLAPESCPRIRVSPPR